MPASSILLRILIFQLLVATAFCRLKAADLPHSNKFTEHTRDRLLIDTIPESDCSNGADDNDNGLTDTNESHCYYYFDSIYHDCKPTSILWASSDLGIHWMNLATNEERLVFPPPENDRFVDLAWVPNGKLFAAGEYQKIFEIDPLTGSFTPIAFVGGYRPNGMTSDARGMLYLTAYADPETCDVLRFDPATAESEKIVRLSDYGLLASGDCCFLNGFLYVTCNGYIARVDLDLKLVEKLKIDNILFDDSYGITTLGDGFLYVTNNVADIYQLDPFTMKATLVSKFIIPDMITTGYASYVDACNAPCQKPVVSLGPDTVVCINGTLQLSVRADPTVSTYEWSNGNTQKANLITAPGTYWVKAGNTCQTSTDTIVVGSIDKPLVVLRNDTLVCSQTSVTLSNLRPSQQGDHYLWSDNSDQPSVTVNSPGSYWLQVTNLCGSVADTVHLVPKIDSCDCFVYIPTAFSPNDDRLNDLFQLSSACSLTGSVRIFNRWGQMVYSSEDLDAGWNGSLAGKPQPQGTYVYTFRFNYLDRPGTFLRKGSVTLLR